MQFKREQEKAFKLWKKVEKYQIGCMVLDSTVDINFWQERVLWEKRLVAEEEKGGVGKKCG
jgi:hypothetical protein